MPSFNQPTLFGGCPQNCGESYTRTLGSGEKKKKSAARARASTSAHEENPRGAPRAWGRRHLANDRLHEARDALPRLAADLRALEKSTGRRRRRRFLGEKQKSTKMPEVVLDSLKRKEGEKHMLMQMEGCVASKSAKGSSPQLMGGVVPLVCIVYWGKPKEKHFRLSCLLFLVLLSLLLFFFWGGGA